jgi:hypothetical protein
MTSKNESFRLLQIPTVHEKDEYDCQDYEERKCPQEDELVLVFPLCLFDEGNSVILYLPIEMSWISQS